MAALSVRFFEFNWVKCTFCTTRFKRFELFLSIFYPAVIRRQVTIVQILDNPGPDFRDRSSKLRGKCA